jgi:hypothetical protein
MELDIAAVMLDSNVTLKILEPPFMDFQLG